MEDDMIPESYKCDWRRVVVRLEKGWYNWCWVLAQNLLRTKIETKVVGRIRSRRRRIRV